MNYLEETSGEWMVVPIQQLRGRHLVVDINARPRRLVQPPRLGPRPAHHPGPSEEGDGDDPGEDHGGPSKGPGTRRPIPTSARTETPSLGTTDVDVSRRDRTRSPPGEVFPPSFSAFPEGPRTSADVAPFRSPTEGEYMPTSPEEEAPMCSPGAEGDEEESREGDPVVHSPKTVQFFSAEDVSSPSAERHGRSEPLEEAVETGVPRGENDAGDPGVPELHDMAQTSILMVHRHEEGMSEVARETAETARRIAQIEASLRANGHYFDDEAGGTFGRPSTAGMALYGQSQGRPRAPEQVRLVADMQPVRPAATLPGKGWLRWAQPQPGTRSGTRGRGTAGAQRDLRRGADERDSLRGQDHGDQGPHDGSHGLGTSDDRGDGRFPPGEGASERRGHRPYGISFCDAYHAHGPCCDGGEGECPAYGKDLHSSDFTSTHRPQPYDGASGDLPHRLAEPQEELFTNLGSADRGGDSERVGGDAGGAIAAQVKSLPTRLWAGAESQEREKTGSLQLGETVKGTVTAGAVYDTTTSLKDVQNCQEKTLAPGMARRLAKAACLTTVLMSPLVEMVNGISNSYDLVEIACSPASSLTSTFEKADYQCLRVNFLTGFNLETRAGTVALRQTLHATPTKLAWVSLPCTRLSSLQNLTQRDEPQMARFLKKRGQDLWRALEVAEALEEVLAFGGDIAWEWPTSATAGWRSKAIVKVTQLVKRYSRYLYFCRLDGCQYGLTWNGMPVRKRWTVMTTSYHLWMTLNKRCPENHEHAECRGNAAQASAYYPPAMCRDILKAFDFQWKSADRHLVKDVENYLLTVPQESQTATPEHPEPATTSRTGSVYALSRRRMLEQAPTGRRLEQIKQQMLRVHRASGHSGFSNLQRLLEASTSPAWAIALAGTLECPECREASKPRPAPPASMGQEPALFEVLGTDVFEIEDEASKMKYKVQIWRDRASGLTMLDILQKFESRKACLDARAVC